MSKKKILSVLLMAALPAIVLCFCFYISGNALGKLPGITQMNYNLKADVKPLAVKDMNKLSERISFDRVSFCAGLKGTKVKEEAVLPVLTNEFYFEIYGQVIKGDGITEGNIANREKVAVIGSSLALKLFFNTDAVGKTITLNNENYTVCGVFEEDSSIINSMSGDGNQRVYIPYTCYSGYEDCEVNIISYDNQSSSAPLIEQMDLSQYHSTNFSEKAKVIRNFEHIIFMLLFIALCFIMFSLWGRICKKFVKDIKENLKKNYILNSLKSIPIKYVLLIITALGIPAVLLVVFYLLDFSIFIVPKYIPDDNIFDVPYYLSVITENSHIMNNLALSGDTFLLNLYSGSFSLLIWLVIIFAVSLAADLCVVLGVLGNMVNLRFTKKKMGKGL